MALLIVIPCQKPLTEEHELKVEGGGVGGGGGAGIGAPGMIFKSGGERTGKDYGINKMSGNKMKR